MNDSEMYFNGCFSPSWIEDVRGNTFEIESNYPQQKKSLETLRMELEEIKDHLQDVQARQWNLEKLLNFHTKGFVKE